MGMMDQHWVLCSMWKSSCRLQRQEEGHWKKHKQGHQGGPEGSAAGTWGLQLEPELCPSSVRLAVGKQAVPPGCWTHKLD